MCHHLAQAEGLWFGAKIMSSPPYPRIHVGVCLTLIHIQPWLTPAALNAFDL